MRTVCKENMCAGCTACLEVCCKNAITVEDGIVHFNAVIDESKCINCGACEKVCPNNTPVKLEKPIGWFHGWADDSIRPGSSSGGAASAIIKSFLSSGGKVCSCVFENGRFGFKILSDVADALIFAGSKYVKSDPSGVFAQIKELLRKGEKVLFLGLPCQVAGLKNFVRDHENLYTVDLICHGSPSPKLLDRYLKECGVSINSVHDIKFRNKSRFGLSVDGKRLMPTRVADSYTRAFLASVDYTENCYFCQFATEARCADITLGDAWGCDADEMQKGVSLILCQSEKGTELLDNAGLHIEAADSEKAKAHNHQLVHPSEKHSGREKFFKVILKGGSFRRATRRAMPKDSIKQNIKYVLSRIKK